MCHRSPTGKQTATSPTRFTRSLESVPSRPPNLHAEGSKASTALAGSPNRLLYERALQAAQEVEERAEARSRSPNTRERVRQGILSSGLTSGTGYDTALRLGEALYGTPQTTLSTQSGTSNAPPLDLGPSSQEPQAAAAFPSGPGPVARAMAKTPIGMSAYQPGPIGRLSEVMAPSLTASIGAVSLSKGDLYTTWGTRASPDRSTQRGSYSPSRSASPVASSRLSSPAAAPPGSPGWRGAGGGGSMGVDPVSTNIESIRRQDSPTEGVGVGVWGCGGVWGGWFPLSRIVQPRPCCCVCSAL